MAHYPWFLLLGLLPILARSYEGLMLASPTAFSIGTADWPSPVLLWSHTTDLTELGVSSLATSPSAPSSQPRPPPAQPACCWHPLCWPQRLARPKSCSPSPLLATSLAPVSVGTEGLTLEMFKIFFIYIIPRMKQ